MMAENEIRCRVEIRADDSRQSPGRLTGTLMKYGERAAGGRSEVFEPDSLTWPADGIVIERVHRAGAPIMRAIPEVRDGAVIVDAQLPDTEAGRSAAVEVRSGLFRHLSVEFRASLQTYQGGVRRIRRAALLAAALVTNPEYHGARVEVRDRRRRIWTWM